MKNPNLTFFSLPLHIIACDGFLICVCVAGWCWGLGAVWQWSNKKIMHGITVKRYFHRIGRRGAIEAACELAEH
jgi:hypothetical protein